VDTGPGIPMARLENLFQPFKSSKKTVQEIGGFPEDAPPERLYK